MSTKNNDVIFGAKNTFWVKAKKAGNKIDKHYWESLHYEAKAKLSYRKYQKSTNEIDEAFDDSSKWDIIKGIAKMTYRKLQSVYYDTKAYSKFPNRFAEPDNFQALEERNYKVKENYKYLIK